MPYTISSPGKYCLRSDLSLSAGTGAAINIQADHMVLDLNGFHLAGTAGPTSSAEGIAVGNFKSITIRNGTVSGFNNGVHLHGDYTADSWDIIEDLRVHDCTYLGIYTSGRGNVIRNNQVGHITGNPDAASGGNRLSVGIFAGGQLNRIIGNDVTDVGIGGVGPRWRHVRHMPPPMRRPRLPSTAAGPACGTRTCTVFDISTLHKMRAPRRPSRVITSSLNCLGRKRGTDATCADRRNCALRAY